jgi:hypothetical protein
MNYDGWQNQLAPYLRRWGSDVDSRWAKLLARMRVGELVTGEVIVKAHFGAWLDIGVGFPALIELPFIRGLTPDAYAADDWCPLGSLLHARVLGFVTSAPQVRLAQVRQVYATITPSERERLFALVAGIGSLDEAIARLGPPSQDLPAGQLSFDPISGAELRHRVLVYEDLSESARVSVVDHADTAPQIDFGTKHLGEEEFAETLPAD